MKKVYNQPIVDTMVLTEQLMDAKPQSQVVPNPTDTQWPEGTAPQRKVFY